MPETSLADVLAALTDLTRRFELLEQRISLERTASETARKESRESAEESRKESRNWARAMIPVAILLAGAIYGNYQGNQATSARVESMDRFGTSYGRDVAQREINDLHKQDAEIASDLVSIKGRLDIYDARGGPK